MKRRALPIPTGLDVRQAGFTLTELMVALVLGALVVLAATAMVVTSRATYRSQDESTRVAENGRFALELVNRLVRLAGYTDFGASNAPPASYIYVGGTDPYVDGWPSIGGIDHDATNGAAVNGSDSLITYYYGSGPAGGPADGNVLDCAGNAVPSPAATANAYVNARERNVLYVQPDVDGEPALVCQRSIYDPVGGGRTYDQQVLIRGVESFQVLFGEAIYAVGPPPGDPDTDPPVSIVYRTGVDGVNPVVNWQNVISVRIALLLRSNIGAQPDATAQTYNLFGGSYNANGDTGTQFSTTALSASDRTRVRRVVQTTVFVRNRIATWPGLQ